MDDFGNDYQTEEWAMRCEQYGFSVATFGFLDDECLDRCMFYNLDYARADI